MRRSHPVRRGSTGQRRKLVWADLQGFSGSPLGLAGAGVNFDLLSAYRTAGGSTQGATIIRTHITIGADYSPTTSVTHAEGIDVGLIIDDLNAPVTELNTGRFFNDWMLLKTFYSMGGNSQWNNAAATPSLVTSYEIDLRAKRKVQELQQTYWLCLAARTAVTTECRFHARTLIALP